MAHEKTKMVADPTELVKPKRRRVLSKSLMSHTNINQKDLMMDIPHEVVHNILSRLSAKPLMRFRCVSTYWNRQITDSYFKSRRRVLFSYLFLHALDDKNVYSTINLPFPFQKYRDWQKSLLIGSLNGIVILANTKVDEFELILYNPLTREAKKLPDPPQSCCIPAREYRCAFGFGYGYNSTPDNSKIIIGYDKLLCECSHKYCIKYCHVFSLEKGSWTTPKTDFSLGDFIQDVGVFSNGYLHWISRYDKRLEIVVLDVEEMKVSRMDVPDGGNKQSSRLGTLNGHLCMINKKHGWFDVWEMKKKRYIDKWSKKYSFKLGIEHGYKYKHLYALCILEDGRIVVTDSKSNNLIFYDLSKGSHEVFKYTDCIGPYSTSIEYVESLASLSDIISYL